MKEIANILECVEALEGQERFLLNWHNENHETKERVLMEMRHDLTDALGAVRVLESQEEDL